MGDGTSIVGIRVHVSASAISESLERASKRLLLVGTAFDVYSNWTEASLNQNRSLIDNVGRTALHSILNFAGGLGGGAAGGLGGGVLGFVVEPAGGEVVGSLLGGFYGADRGLDLGDRIYIQLFGL